MRAGAADRGQAGQRQGARHHRAAWWDPRQGWRPGEARRPRPGGRWPRGAARLDGAQYRRASGIAYQYLGFGSYLGGWRRRNALKMWTGWPTFPMVFVKGILIGGADELVQLVGGGELKRTLGE